MEISEIKTNLSLQQILEHYNLQPNKNKMLQCPFHEDKTASLQVNYERNQYKCHACGKKGDQIQFVEDFEKLTKHEALKKCTELASPLTPEGGTPNIMQNSIVPPLGVRGLFLEKMFLSFRKGLMCSEPAKEYCKSRNLDFDKLEIGFNSGQFHHGERKDEELIKNCLHFGLLTTAGINSRTGGQAYKPFGNRCILFPLRNKENQIVSFYFRSTINNEDAKHFYLKNRQGLYPNYPKKETKKLILTEAIIDTATLLQIESIKNNYEILTCFGTNGLNEEVLNAIKELKQLEEIIFAFDNDEAGKTAVNKYANLLLESFPPLGERKGGGIKISIVTPINKDINETLQLHTEEIFLELLDKRTDFLFSTEEKKTEITIEKPTTTEELLTQKNLIQNLNQLIGKAGIVGEENSRMLLFLIIISYLNKNPLHALVQGSSGSGKTHIISRIADLMPQEDVLRFTRITESSLYNWGEFDMYQKVLILEDLDGLKPEALYALREFISAQYLKSLTSIKDKKGNNKSASKEVRGQFSSLSATTKGELYEDNMNRSFVIAVDESREQTQKIIDYQNQKIAGKIDKNQEKIAVETIRKIVKNLKNFEVINPFATHIQLPDNVKNKRRLNEMVQAVIKQITIINQYQRQETENGELITTIEDLKDGINILFESIILKIDELDGSLRQFLETLKKSFAEREFNRFEAMEKTGYKKSQLQILLNELVRLEYLKQKGFSNKGFTYKIGYQDNMKKIRTDLKEHFRKIIESLQN